MKTLLLHNFYQPYYFYDKTIFCNKDLNKFETRKRASAISFSHNEEIIIVSHICSPVDQFNKKIAKYGDSNQIVGLNTKLLETIEGVHNTHSILGQPPFSSTDMGNNCYYFKNLNSFVNETLNITGYLIRQVYPINYYLKPDILDYTFPYTFVVQKHQKFFNKIADLSNV